jgi:PAS domain S-box-containing protein
MLHTEESTIQTLSEILSRYDFHLEVLQTLQLQPGYFKDHRIDLVLLGTPLQIGNSYEVCQQLTQNRITRDIPVILVGDRDPHQIAAAFAAGASDYLSLPLLPEELVARIQYHLTGYRRSQQLSHQNALLLQEVRERKQIETALRQAEEKYRRIFENATEGIFQSSKSGRYISVNPSLAQIYGYDSPDDLMQQMTDIGRQLYVQPKRRDELVVYLKQYEKIVGAESEVLRKDGSKIWISETIRKVYDADGNFLYYEGIVHDITERRRIEMELRH